MSILVGGPKARTPTVVAGRDTLHENDIRLTIGDFAGPLGCDVGEPLAEGTHYRDHVTILPESADT